MNHLACRWRPLGRHPVSIAGSLVVLSAVQLVAAPPAVKATMSQPLSAPSVRGFGRLPDGREASLYTLAVPGGWQATVTDYGAILTAFLVPSSSGGEHAAPVDVVLGFDSLDGYLAGHPYFGATCGRVANRIAGGSFELDGRRHQLAKNNGAHHLHGGIVGFDKKLWKGESLLTERGPAVRLELESPDGDEGYPGRLVARVVYTLTPAGELLVDMTATSDAATIVNLAHHSYWNLAGQASGGIRGHELTVVADRYLPTDAGGIPTGDLAAVKDTPFDFRPERGRPGTLGAAIDALPPAGGSPGGVDHNFVIRDWKPDGGLRRVAVLRDPASGRSLEILSDQPGIQVYTGNFLDGTLRGKQGAVYARQSAVCLETQRFPDSIHHPDWPAIRLEPGQTYRHSMVHRFAR